VTEVTENTVNTLVAQYLAREHIPVLAQTSELRTGHGIPDFTIKGASTLYGEGEWSSKYADGLIQASNYGDAPGADGYFLLAYPETLRKQITREWRRDPADLDAILGGVTYRGVLKVGKEPARPWRGLLEGIPKWLKDGIERRPQPPDPDEFVNAVQDLVENLALELPLSGDWPLLFEHADSVLERDSGQPEHRRRAAAYLLLDQIVFYRILQERGFPELKPAGIDSPLDLKRNYFDQVRKENYHAIYDLDICSKIPIEATSEIRTLVRVINVLQPEQFTRDLLGNIFHRLIPQEVRKPVAAFYTNVSAARLLAKLSIEGPAEKVADLACGSGTLLMAAYDRKAELSGKTVDKATHREFVEEDLTGVDIMSFAAHLAVVQLALRNPAHFTDKARVAVYNSTALGPGFPIRPIAETIVGPRPLETWSQEGYSPRKVRRGAVSSEGAGKGFTMKTVDVVLMNPPFTRKQSIPKENRDRMNKSLKEYAKFIDNGMNLSPYFILLADRFLRPGGRIAMVLPDSILDQDSAAGVRSFLSQKYQIEFIIQAGHRLAFSEDAAFLEILLVARKRRRGEVDRQAVVARLGIKPTDANSGGLADSLKELRSAEAGSAALKLFASQTQSEVVLVPQPEFASTPNWVELLPHAGIAGFELPRSPSLAPLRSVALRVTQGLRFNKMEGIWDPESTYLSVPRAAKVRSRWEVLSESAGEVEAFNKKLGLKVRVPRGVLRASTRSASGMPSIEITHPWDYTVLGRFPGDDKFWNVPDPDSVVATRLKKYSEKETHLIAAGRNNVDLRSDTTHFLAFVSPEKIAPPWQFWVIKTVSLADAKIIGLWWNSTPHLAQLLLSRGRGMGSYGGWEKGDLEPLPVLNPQVLSPAAADVLMKVYDRWAKVSFPSLRDQMEGPFEGRVAIDQAICHAAGIEAAQFGLPALYGLLLERIDRLGIQGRSE
jgi:tRNA1(Val) A37 N6-methylase TrmN6